MILWRQSMPSLASVAPTATVVFFEVPVVSDAPTSPSPDQPWKNPCSRALATLAFSASVLSPATRASISATERGLVFLDRSTAVARVAGFPVLAASVMSRTIGSGTGPAQAREGAPRYSAQAS